MTKTLFEDYRRFTEGADHECWTKWPEALTKVYKGRPIKVVDFGPYIKTGAHRAMWQAKNGPLSAQQKLYNTCGNKECVNPAHYYAQTAREFYAKRKDARREEVAAAAALGLPPPLIKTSLTVDALLKNKVRYMMKDLSFMLTRGEITTAQYSKMWAMLKSQEHPDLQEYKRAILAGEIYELVTK